MFFKDRGVSVEFWLIPQFKVDGGLGVVKTWQLGKD